MDNKTYALVSDNEVVLYPLTIEDINQRNDPTETYLECYYAPGSIRPIAALTDKVIETPMLLGRVVYVQEKLVKKTIDEMFDYLHEVATSYDENQQPYLDRSLISLELFQAFEVIIKIHVQKMLDDFALTRDYDDIKSACDYITSSVQRYRDEAARALYLRDAIWPMLFDRYNGIIAGTYPIPNSWSDIAQYLPELTWEDEE